MDEKVYTPEVVQETPFPGEVIIQDSQSQSSLNGTYSPVKTNSKPIPRKKVAVELLSSALNTRSKKILEQFDLQDSGGFRVGKFEEGISGDLRITPNGLTARDLAGIITFAIDGLTGDAIFKGTIQSGSVITGSIISQGSIDGASININDRFIVDELGNITIINQEPTVLMDVLYDDLIIEMINLDIGKPGTGYGQLRFYSNGVLYAHINPDDGLSMGSNKPITLSGTGAPSAPGTNSGSLFIDQSGGKNRLMVRFPTGASQVIATEP